VRAGSTSDTCCCCRSPNSLHLSGWLCPFRCQTRKVVGRVSGHSDSWRASTRCAYLVLWVRKRSSRSVVGNAILERITYGRRELGLRRSACSGRRDDREQTRGIEYHQVCSTIHNNVGIRQRWVLSSSWERRKTQNALRELVLVKKDVVVCRLARAENPCVTIEIVVKLHRANDACVDNGAGDTIHDAVGIISGFGKEYHLVILANDDECNFWSEAQFVTCVCIGVGRRLLGTQGGKMSESRIYFG